MDSRLFTIRTLAERWGVHPATIRKMIRAGNLDHFSVGKEIRINQETVIRKEGWTHDIDLENPGRYVVQWYEAVKDGSTFQWKQRRVNLKLSYTPENRVEAEKLLADFKSQQMNALDASVKEVWRSYKMANPDGQFYAENHILPFFGDLDTNKISVPMCEAYIEKRRKEGAKDSTIRRELASLKASVRKFALEGHRNFVFELPSPPPPKDRWLTRDEFRGLRQAFEPMPHLALFIEIAIATAARKSAICQMRWNQVDF